MGTVIKIELRPGLSDNSIREITLQYPNGHYAVWICKNCGNYATHQDGNTSDAFIRNFCDDCYDDTELGDGDYYLNEEDRWLAENEAYWNESYWNILHKDML